MESLNTRSFSAFETAWSKYLPIAFLFLQYEAFAYLSICYVFCLLYSLLCINKYGTGEKFTPILTYTCYFLGYLIIITFLYGKFETSLLVYLYRYAITIFIIVIISQHVDKDAMYKTWKWLGVIVGVAIIIQSIQVHVLHQQITTIPLLPGYGSGRITDFWTFESSRPRAFFSEPSMTIAFLTPVLFWALSKKETIYCLFISLCILLTTSTSGLIVLLILWGSHVYFSRMKRSQKILYAIIFALLSAAFFSMSIFNDSVEKLNLELSGDSSNFFGRVLSGWLLYGHLDLNTQIFGIPNVDYTQFIRDHAGAFSAYVSQTTMLDEERNFFFNTAQHVFLRSGLVGAILYLYMLNKLYKAAGNIILPYFICVVAMMFFELNFFYHNCFIIQYTVLLSYIRKDSSLIKTV